jgi:hypothetical protein
MLKTSSTSLTPLGLRGDYLAPCPALRPAVVALPMLEILRVEGSHNPRRILCLRGTVWVTVEGSEADLILRAGDSVDLAAGGLILAEALTDSAVEVVPGG